MTKLALALTATLVLGPASVGVAGEGSPDQALPSKAEHYGIRTVAPVLARTSIEGATVPTFDAEKAWLQRASRAYDG